MPLGETIGTAYIRILADGTGLSEDIRRQMRANERAMQTEGQHGGRAYTDGFRSELRKRGNTQTAMRRLQQDLERGAGRFDAAGELVGSHLLDGVRNELEGRFGEVGTVIFRNLKEELEKGTIDFTGLRRKLRNIRPEVAKAVGDVTKGQQIMFEDLGRAVDDYSKRMLKGRSVRLGFLHEMQTLGAQLPRTVTDTDKFRRAIGEMSDILLPAGGRLRRFRDDMGKAGNVIGKAFGKGSRNNFLNFFGGFATLLPSMMKGIGTITGGLGKLVGEFNDVRQSALDAGRGGIGAFVEAIGSLASAGLPGLIAAAAAVGGTIGTLAAALPTLGAAVSAVIGMVLALAGSLAFALVGGLVAVAGALIPFAAAFGVAAIAMSNLDKKSKFFKDFQKVWQDFKKTAQTAIFGKDMGGLGAFSSVLKSLKPLVKTIGGAIGGLLKQLSKAAGSKDFQNWIKDVNKMLGPMIKTIGSIAGNIGTFIGEAFVAAGPIIREFLGWLDKVTGQLAAFGKPGKGGKSGLSKFFEDAWDSAKKVGRLIKDIVLVAGDLLGAGRDTGDSIFTSMAKQVEKLHKWLSDPANKKSIDEWFASAEQVASAFGRIVLAVIGFIDALDTPTSRKMLLGLLSVIETIIGWLTTGAGLLDQWNQTIFRAAEKVRKFFDAIKQGFSDLGGEGSAWDVITQGLSDAKGKIVGFFKNLAAAIVTAAGDIGSAIGTWFSGVWGVVSAVPGKITGFFSGLATKIWTAAGDLVGSFGTWILGVVTSIPGIIDRILTAWAGLDNKIATSMGDMASTFATWLAGLPEQAITVAGQIIVGFIDLAGRMILAAGSVLGAFTQWLADLPGKSVQAAVNIAFGFANLSIRIINAAGSLAAAFGTWLATVPGKVRQVAAQAVAGFANLAGRVIKGAGNIAARFATWVTTLPAKARAIATQVAAGFANLAGKIIARAGSIAGRFAGWIASLPGKARSIANQVAAGFANMAGKIIARAGSIAGRFASWVAGLPGKARSIAQQIANAFSGLASKAIAKAGSIVAAIGRWASGVGARAAGVANDIVNAFRGLASRIVAAIGTIIPKIQMPHITIPHITAIVDKPKAAGGIAMGPTYGLYGEAGPEALVPLNRPLNQVDPAVRMLSAFAQGKLQFPAAGKPGRTIDVGGITINTPTEDPRAVASEVVAHMAAAAYI